MIVAGIGARAGVSAAEVAVAIDAAWARVPEFAGIIGLIAVPAQKRHEAGILAAAIARNLAVVAVGDSALREANARTQTNSPRILAMMNVNSAAEAAALAAAGAHAYLLVPRVSVGRVTCALAYPASMFSCAPQSVFSFKTDPHNGIRSADIRRAAIAPCFAG